MSRSSYWILNQNCLGCSNGRPWGIGGRWRSAARILLVCVAAFTLHGCEQKVRKRPFGYLRLGQLSDYSSSETFLETEGLLIRSDSGGLYAMSTFCSHDLSPLRRVKTGAGSYKFVSQYSSSEYDRDGHVLKGPAVAPLPYYELLVAPETMKTGPDSQQVSLGRPTLFVKLGVEKSPSWRYARDKIGRPR